MKSVPMIFNTDMVKALLDGRKTVTRRSMKVQPQDSGLGYMWIPSNKHQSMIQISNIEDVECLHKKQYLKDLIYECCPYGRVGDLIYVRETWADAGANAPELTLYKANYPEHVPAHYENVPSLSEIQWKPSIHMPRWASRLTLKVTDVSIERVQDITEEQAIKEGLFKHPQLPAWQSPVGYHTSPIYAYEELWDAIYNNWDQNPYVWVIEFEVIHKNIDDVLREAA